MIKRESKFSLRFKHWMRANPPKVTCHYELKQTTTGSIPFACYEPQQVAFGEAINHSPKGVLVRNLGTNGEPDYSYFYRDPVYLVIYFPQFFCFITLDTFLYEKGVSSRKSLTAERAREISVECIDL